MTFAERGAYIEFLTCIFSAKGNGVVDDDAEIAALLGRPMEEWLAVKDSILSKCYQIAGRWHNEKVDAQIAWLRARIKGGISTSTLKGTLKGTDIAASQSQSRTLEVSSSSLDSRDIEVLGRDDAHGNAKGCAKTKTDKIAPASAADVDAGRRPPTQKIDFSFHIQTWNTIAAEQGLNNIKDIKPGSPRRKFFKARLKEYPDFWDTVIPVLRDRGKWAREGQFPTFDQLVAASTFQKLIEGNYKPKPGENNQGETNWGQILKDV
jgi:uncharacterized protein YdaU (DUF1376 family)